MRTLRAAIIGAGRIATVHLACLHRLPAARLVAVCDVSPGRAEAMAARWGAPAWYRDHRRLLEEARPEIVHVTTPPATHVPLALDALRAGAHVIVEKPAACDPEGVERLLAAGEGRFVETYTYVFSSQTQRLLHLAASGGLGDVVHVDVSVASDMFAAGSPFVDPHLPHPALALPGGAIGDFLPHLASLAVAFIGPHRAVASAWRRRGDGGVGCDDEMRALVDGAGATAGLSFSGNARPAGLWLRVEAERGRAVANLFETRLTLELVRPVPRPVATALNDLAAARDAAADAVRGLVRKLDGGPGSYEGLWTLIERTYAAVSSGGALPVTGPQILAVNRLVAELVAGGNRL